MLDYDDWDRKIDIAVQKMYAYTDFRPQSLVPLRLIKASECLCQNSRSQTFTGEILDWQSLWGTFESAVHHNIVRYAMYRKVTPVGFDVQIELGVDSTSNECT